MGHCVYVNHISCDVNWSCVMQFNSVINENIRVPFHKINNFKTNVEYITSYQF